MSDQPKVSSTRLQKESAKVGKLFAVMIALVTVVHASATTVKFQGYLYGLNPFGGTVSPVIGGRIIVGAFKPGFDVGQYTCIYGDSVCNLDGSNYLDAVADGNFIPLSNVVDTNPLNVTIPNKDRSVVLSSPSFFGLGEDGYFSGTGTTNAVGSQLWIFGFAGEEPIPIDFTEVLASSSSNAFRVPASGSVTIDAAQTNLFFLGQHYSNGIALTGIPIPEPISITLFSIAALLLAVRRHRHR